jgi:hypothetical protein
MRFNMRLAVAVLLAVGSSATSLSAQGGGNAAELQKKLDAEFSLTKTTADRSDIVTAGSVLVIHKDGLVMYSTPTETAPLNIYKNGAIQFNSGSAVKQLGLKWIKERTMPTSTDIPQRKFVAGEKFWVTGINMQSDGVVFNVYSDPFSDVRYYGQLKFPFPKNSIPPTDDVVKNIEDVITVQPSDDAADKKDSAPAQSASAPAAPAAAMAPIAPPPPPADQPPPPPKTIAVGQSKAVVVAAWGQPTKVVKLATKEIYYYPDMKVTFVAGKVSDVQ